MNISDWCAIFCISFPRVSDEKEARGYLQALATKMTEELEALKPSAGYGTLSKVSLYYETFLKHK